MPPAKDLTEKKFGKLTVKYKSGKDKHGNILWYCECDCGGNNIVRSKDLNNGNVKSCGCLNKEIVIKLNTKNIKCIVDSCNNKHYGLGYCGKHYQEYKKHGRILGNEERKEIIKKSRSHPKKPNNLKCTYCENIGFKNKAFGIVLCRKHVAQLKRNGVILKRTRYDENEIILYKNEKIAEIILYDLHNKESGRAIIDIDNVEAIRNYKWYKNADGYAETNLSDNTHLRLHRFLLDAPDELDVDHKNRKRLDCRFDNIRLCTKPENNRNGNVRKDSKSQIRGVYQDNYNKWTAYITFNKKKIHLGYFINIEDAIKARIDAENKYFGDFAPNKFDEGVDNY
jgi:hypothetical protein